MGRIAQTSQRPFFNELTSVFEILTNYGRKCVLGCMGGSGNSAKYPGGLFEALITNMKNNVNVIAPYVILTTVSLGRVYDSVIYQGKT